MKKLLLLLLCIALTGTMGCSLRDDEAEDLRIADGEADEEESVSLQGGKTPKPAPPTPEPVAASKQSGAQLSVQPTGDFVDITEKMYVTYINDIYTNREDYLGDTVQLEGKFEAQFYEPTNTVYCYVFRTGPGCCGNDGAMCGFEFTYDGQLPQNNDWIRVKGILNQYEEDGNNYLSILAQEVEVLDVRGAEVVSQ